MSKNADVDINELVEYASDDEDEDLNVHHDDKGSSNAKKYVKKIIWRDGIFFE